MGCKEMKLLPWARVRGTGSAVPLLDAITSES